MESIFKQKAIIFISLVAMLFGVVVISQPVGAEAKVYAHQCAENAARDGQCVKNLHRQLEDKRGVTEEQYLDMVEACTEQDDGWFSAKADGGQCGNAVIYCIRNSISTAQCNEDKVTSDLAGCNNGMGMKNPKNASSQNNEACQALLKSNEKVLGQAEETLKDKARDTCKEAQKDLLNEDAIKEKCAQLVVDAANKCDNDMNIDKATTVDLNAYNKCMNDEMLKNTKDPDSCKERGGFWLDGACKTLDQARETAVTQAECDKYNGALIEGINPSTGHKTVECRDKAGTCYDKAANKYTLPENYPDKKCPANTEEIKPPTSSSNPSSPGAGNNTDAEECGGARLVFFPADSIAGCDEEGTPAIGGVLKFVMTILSVGVGIVAVGGVVYGSLLYAGARDNGGQTEQAMTIIRNVVIGVLLYIFMITILNWLVPGGVIG